MRFVYYFQEDHIAIYNNISFEELIGEQDMHK